ncbi:MAG: TolC family protein [Candidatus Eremiobacteraeota bacterium]|nr:TolC family protein [Candidatus Eremiobacteraeota bacterium]MCW5869402.1 TolC family protein [Candidatus Eremiobacteraeota bacterium]
MRPLVGLFFVLLGWNAAAQAPPSPIWTPETVMRQAAERLPSVQVARALLQSAQAYAGSIGAQPNPALRLSAVRGVPVEEANALVFKFEVAGQPGLREQSAESAAEARSEELIAEKRVVALKTGQAFYSYWEKFNVQQVVDTRVQLAQELERSSYRRLSVGEISQNSYLRSQLELAKARADLVTARVEAEQARGLLNLYLGRGVEEPLPVEAASVPLLPSTNRPTATLPELQAGLAALPEVDALRHDAKSQDYQTELARRANSPDLMVQLYRDRFGPTDVQAVQVAINIPLWDWGTVAAEVGRREGLAEAAHARVAERQLVLEQKAMETWKRYQGALEREKILGEQATHFAKLSGDARRAYDANLMTLLEVFDVQSSFRQAVQAYITAQADVARAALEIGALRKDGFFEEVSRVQP